MKSLLFLAVLFVYVSASFNHFDLSAGGRYLINGTTSFSGWTNFTGSSAPSATVWAQSPGKYFQDLGSGGQYYYYPDSAYAIRNGVCYNITGYNSSVLTSTYGQALSVEVDDKVDNRTYFGMSGSTCGTALSNLFKVNANGVLKYWVFRQLSPLIIPGVFNVCLDVQGQIDFTDVDVVRHFDESIFNLPASCTSSSQSYCANFYFQPGQQCNYKLYFVAQ